MIKRVECPDFCYACLNVRMYPRLEIATIAMKLVNNIPCANNLKLSSYSVMDAPVTDIVMIMDRLHFAYNLIVILVQKKTLKHLHSKPEKSNKWF